MATPPHQNQTNTPERAPGSPRWSRSRRRLVVIVMIKLGAVAALLALPAGLAISLGVAHAVMLLLIVAGGAVALVLRRRRGGAPRAGWSHRFRQFH